MRRSMCVLTSRFFPLVVATAVAFSLALPTQAQTSHWGVVNLDAESITMFAGALALENQGGWAYYNGPDAPGGAYMGTLGQAQLLTRLVQLPRALTPGRYYVFFEGF